MEPTLAQIKEYIMEKGINVFADTISENRSEFQLFGDNQTEVYYQYYLEHSVEICEWLNGATKQTDNVPSFR